MVEVASSENREMKPRDTGLVVAAIVASLMIAESSQSELIDFEDLVLGTRYFGGDTFVSAGVTMTVTNAGGGHIDVQDLGQAWGTGNELEFFGGPSGGVSLAFDFGVDVDEINLLFGDYGGSLHLLINGDLVIVGSFADLPSTLGGVDITMTGQGGLGTLGLDGVITSFAIGGQELVLDTVSYQPIPGPSALAIVGMGVAGATARRRRREGQLRDWSAEPHHPSADA